MKAEIMVEIPTDVLDAMAEEAKKQHSSLREIASEFLIHAVCVTKQTKQTKKAS